MQRSLLIVWVAVLFAWVGVSAQYLNAVWAIAGALALPLIHAGVLALEFMLMYRANRLDPRHSVRAWNVVTSWCAETLISARVFYWEQPFRPQKFRDQVRSQKGQRALVLIHGLLCNRGFWNPWMHRLRALGIPHLAITIEPVFGTIDDGCDAIDAAVRQVTQATGLAPVIVTHSMGGLSVRAWLRSRSGDDRVHRIITIAAPHQGTALARLGASDVAKRMRIGSSWLTTLVAAEPPSRYRLFTCFYGHCDNIVFPTANGTLPGADNRHVSSSAHIQMVHRDEVFREVVRWLK